MAKNANGSGSLYQRSGSKVWVASWYEAGKRKTRTTKTGDKAAARRLLAKWTEAAALRSGGLIDAADERVRDANNVAVSTHLASWKSSLIAKGSSERHCGHVHEVASRVLRIAGVENLSQLSPERVQRALESLKRTGASTRTLNHARGAVRSFSRWLMMNGLTRSDTTAALSPVKGTDTRRERRALTHDEAAILVNLTEQRGPVFGGVNGKDRAIAYRLALGTGFRANEIRQLLVADVDTLGCSIRVRAGSAKNRRETTQPIAQELADALSAYFATAQAKGNGKAFKLPQRTADAMRGDLRRARVWWCRNASTSAERRSRWRSGLLSWSDSAGRVADFHSLRVSYITHLVAGGVNIKAAQELARHSDPKLTLGVYTRLGLSDTRRALQALPSFDEAKVSPLKLESAG